MSGEKKHEFALTFLELSFLNGDVHNSVEKTFFWDVSVCLLKLYSGLNFICIVYFIIQNFKNSVGMWGEQILLLEITNWQ